MEVESGSERFRVPKTSFQENVLVNDAVPASTKYKNKWAVSIFAEWQRLLKERFKFRYQIVVVSSRTTIYPRLPTRVKNAVRMRAFPASGANLHVPPPIEIIRDTKTH